MEFYDIDNEWCTYKGVWVDGDIDLYEMALKVDECSDDEYAYVFEYWNWMDPKDSWYLHINVHASGTPDAITLHITTDGEHVGYATSKGGNEWENILLGIYDAIECWFNGLEIFSVTR